MKENSVSISEIYKPTIAIEQGIAFTLLVLVFSWEFHALWLMYDILAFVSLYFISKHMSTALALALLLALVSFIILTIFSGLHIISILSIWDNIKHIFVLFMLLSVVERHLEGRILKFTKSFGFIVGCIFILQSLLVFYQYFNGYYKDDISGTFGTASGHSIAYYCLLYLGYLFYDEKSKLLIFFVFCLSLLMNYFAENMGYYPLVILLLSYKWMTPKGLKYIFSYSAILIIAVFILDRALGGILIQPVINRFVEFFLVGNRDLNNFTPSRGYMTALALSLGGWFGAGPGCYSDIYSFLGWNNIAPIQINISSATNLLAEYGVLGFLIWIYLYLIFIKRFFRKNKDFIFISVFFVFSIFYNRVLNDERIIFLLIFLFMFLKVHMDRKNLIND